jgi:epoxyqueuosine reductase
LYPEIGRWIFGCDICQEVCPHNQPTELTSKAKIHESYVSNRDSLDVLDVLFWDEESRREHFRGSAMKRAKLGMIRRNAVIVAGNILAESDDLELRGVLEKIAGDAEEDALVQEAARVVLAQN